MLLKQMPIEIEVFAVFLTFNRGLMYEFTEESSERFLDTDASELFRFITDNGGRRSGFDRRTFFYARHIPDRRCGADRRSAIDRRRQKRQVIRVERSSREDRRKSLEQAIFNLLPPLSV